MNSPDGIKRVLLVTGHHWDSRRKAGFHWIADALERMGWDVTFFTTPLSHVSALRRDRRLTPDVRREANRLIRKRDRLRSYVWYTPFHPFDLRNRLLNRVMDPLFSAFPRLPLGEAEPAIRGADLFIFESVAGLLLFDRFRRLNPDARFVYRVSDDLRELLNHPSVIRAEDRIAPLFDMISVPTQTIHRHFQGLPNLRLHHHGVRKDLFDAPHSNPYPPGETPNVVFVGNSHFDHDFLNRASTLFPRWMFHIIGPIEDLPRRENVIAYGEIPFAETIPYLKYADIGLQIRSGSVAPTLADSLKVIQYTYCHLPIVLPDLIRSTRPHFCYYTPGNDETIRTALETASRYDRSGISTDGIYSWDELVEELAEEGRNRSTKEEAKDPAGENAGPGPGAEKEMEAP